MWPPRLDVLRKSRNGWGMQTSRVGRTIAEARAFIATQAPPQHAPTIHWLDQGSSRLADRASIGQLQQMWRETEDEASRLERIGTDAIDQEATRLFRLALAMAIVARAEPSVRLPVDLEP
jgi:hypothetical protein